MSEPQNKESLRKTLVDDLHKFKHYGTPFTEDMADHILTLLETHDREIRLDELQKLALCKVKATYAKDTTMEETGDFIFASLVDSRIAKLQHLQSEKEGV